MECARRICPLFYAINFFYSPGAVNIHVEEEEEEEEKEEEKK